MGSREIFALRKQGRLADALGMARAEFSGNEDDIWFLRSYAWALYDHVKTPVEDYVSNRLSASAMSHQITPLMREFSRMGLPLQGDTAFSQMLRLAGRVSSDWHDFLAFARWAGTDGFSPDDKAPFVNDQGRKIDSLQKRFTRAICREMVADSTDPSCNPDLIAWGREVLQRCLHADPNDQWLNYYQSKLDLIDGDVDHAIQSLVPVLRRQPRAAWTWALLGEILEGGHRDDALVCFIYATVLAREEQEVAKVRIHLAHLLALVERYGEAADQARSAHRYREEHGYKIPSELAQLLASDWYKAAVRDEQFMPLSNVTKEAKNLLQRLDKQTLEFSSGAIDHINQEKALSYVATSCNDGLVLLHRKFPEAAQLPPGTIVEVGRATNDGPPLDWRHSEVSSLPGLCEMFSGTLVRHEGKTFAFLRSAAEDVFVPPNLAQEFEPGEECHRTCVALRRANKKGKVGWRAVRFV